MISVIVPLAVNEEFTQDCINELKKLPSEFELIIVGEVKPKDLADNIKFIEINNSSRAKALNTGAKNASHDWLWFLHSDTKISTKVIETLLAAIKKHPLSLLFFKLGFHDGYLIHEVNSWGANLRSVLFNAPFGDQAFCVPKKVFESINGFREDVAYGEDHLFARAVKRNKFSHVMLKGEVMTSARKHKEVGWLKLFIKYQWMWISQALSDDPIRN